MSPYVIIRKFAFLILVCNSCCFDTIAVHAYTMFRTSKLVLDAIHRSRNYASLFRINYHNHNHHHPTSNTIRHLPTHHNAFLGSDYNVFSSSSISQQPQQQQHVPILEDEMVMDHPYEDDTIMVAAEVQMPTTSTIPISPSIPLNNNNEDHTIITKNNIQPKSSTKQRSKSLSTLNGKSTSTRAVASNDHNNNDYYYYDDDHFASSYDDTIHSGTTTTTTSIVDPNALTIKNGKESCRPEYEAARYPPTEMIHTVEDYSTIEEYFIGESIRSRPKSNGGNWNVIEPLAWSKDFGRRSPQYDTILSSIIQLRPGDDGYYDVSDIIVPNTTIVRTKEQAQIVMHQLMNADPNIVHACDTEVMDIDLKSVGPVGNGYCTCVSIYSGPNFDYGLGHGPGSTLWIDNLDDACGMIHEFKDWFESEQYKKVWHNYGFDRHILWNEGIDLNGFWGDTMHMARLQDSSRAKTAGAGGYGLEALTSDLLQERKQPMKELFGVKRLRKDGTEGTLVDIPPVEVLQRDPKYRPDWIKYSAMDAKSTWLLREELTKLLKTIPWIGPDTNMYDYYELHMRPFGEVLTDMERRGIRVDANDYLAKVEIQARQDRAHHVEVFRQWAAKQIGANGLAINTASSTQLCTFLFGGAINQKTNEETERVREFKVPRTEIPEDALEAFRLEEEAMNQKQDTPTGLYNA
jgi:3'-5' exonuclease